VPVPILGPDLIDPRRNPEIKKIATAKEPVTAEEG
jgi:hypothetical protein